MARCSRIGDCRTGPPCPDRSNVDLLSYSKGRGQFYDVANATAQMQALLHYHHTASAEPPFERCENVTNDFCAMSGDIHQLKFPGSGYAVARSHAASLIEITLDMLPIGIVLVDADARIVHRNAVAGVMLSFREPIVSDHGQLRASCKVAVAGLMAAICQATGRREGPHSASISVALRYRDGRAAVAHVHPLNVGLVHRGQASGAAAAVFITETAEHAPPPLEALTTLFNLTPSEARVLEQIVLGRNRRESAVGLGVAVSTVKTHLERIYSKTGTSDQLGLCRLVSALSMPARSLADSRR
jgi:DNA-binding CsgD family transcriptional regulator